MFYHRSFTIRLLNYFGLAENLPISHICLCSCSAKSKNTELISCQHQRRKWHPTPVLLPGKSHERRSLVGCSPWGRKESDMTEQLPFHFSLSCIGRKWQPTPVFLPGESQGRGNLVGFCLWGHTESDTTEVTQQQHHQKK